MFLQVATEACQLTVLKTITTNPGRNWPIWGLYMSPFKMSKTRPCIFPFASWGHARLEACIPKAIPGGEVWSAGTQQAPAAKIRCSHLNSVFHILQSSEPALTCWQEFWTIHIEPTAQSQTSGTMGISTVTCCYWNLWAPRWPCHCGLEHSQIDSSTGWS